MSVTWFAPHPWDVWHRRVAAEANLTLVAGDDVAHIVRRHVSGASPYAIAEHAEASGTRLAMNALCGKHVDVSGHSPDELAPCMKCVTVWQREEGRW